MCGADYDGGDVRQFGGCDGADELLLAGIIRLHIALPDQVSAASENHFDGGKSALLFGGYVCVPHGGGGDNSGNAFKDGVAICAESLAELMCIEKTHFR